MTFVARTRLVNKCVKYFEVSSVAWHLDMLSLASTWEAPGSFTRSCTCRGTGICWLTAYMCILHLVLLVPTQAPDLLGILSTIRGLLNLIKFIVVISQSARFSRVATGLLLGT